MSAGPRYVPASRLDPIRPELESLMVGMAPPVIVIIGDESSGKSQLLEMLIQMSLLPRRGESWREAQKPRAWNVPRSPRDRRHHPWVFPRQSWFRFSIFFFYFSSLKTRPNGGGGGVTAVLLAPRFAP